MSCLQVAWQILLCVVAVRAVKIQRSAVGSTQCPAGSTTFTLPPHKPPNDHTFNRVVMADYPSTGSTWLRQLIEAVSEDSGKCASPSCSIYGGCLVDKPGVRCACKGKKIWKPREGALFFKTHFPSQEQYHGQSLSGWQYTASSHFNKMMLLVRHPVSTVTSSLRRWGGDVSILEENIHCWGTWWERARDAVGESNVMVMRYEDLCINTPEVVHKFLQFMGGCYKDISLESVESILSKRTDLKCYYSVAGKYKLSARTSIASPEAQKTVRSLADLMTRWGYSTTTNEWLTPLNSSHAANEATMAQIGGTGAKNPWSSIWAEPQEPVL